MYQNILKICRQFRNEKIIFFLTRNILLVHSKFEFLRRLILITNLIKVSESNAWHLCLGKSKAMFVLWECFTKNWPVLRSAMILNVTSITLKMSKEEMLQSPMQQSSCNRRRYFILRTAQIQLLCTDKTLRASEEPSGSSTPYDMTEEIKP